MTSRFSKKRSVFSSRETREPQLPLPATPSEIRSFREGLNASC
ncbi:MAG: hypothetical protein WC242_00215 [Candidatus Paceibacterota bacterium]